MGGVDIRSEGGVSAFETPPRLQQEMSEAERKQNKEEEHGNVNASQDIYNYFLNTFDIITMLRKAILKIRTEMKDTIDYELGRADQGYVQSVGIISVLSLLSPVIVIFINERFGDRLAERTDVLVVVARVELGHFMKR